MYLGGKTRVARHIAEQIAQRRGARQTYVEPFLGSAAVASRVAPTFDRALLSDASPDLMLMWQALQDGWAPPTSLSEPEWRTLRDAAPSALRGFAGFPCSFGGKWFGGYARDPKGGRNFAASAARSVTSRAATIAHADLRLGDYRAIADAIDPTDTVIYADPPYSGTTAYGAVAPFDTAEFWDTARGWADSGVLVLVSEYAAPDDWRPVWSRETPVTLAKANHLPDGRLRTAVESLYVVAA